MNKKEMTAYNTDASRSLGVAKKVVFPKVIEDVQKFIRLPHEDLVPRGAGTGLVGGAVPHNSIVVDMTKMNKVLNFSSAARTVTVEAGMTLKELNERLNAKGFEFPIIPSNLSISTIGGMIATNANGRFSLRYGKMKDWITELVFVNGRGEIVKTGRADLTDVCGMEGITGIIVSATLKVIPTMKRSASIFQTDNLEEIFSIARRLKLEKDVNMLQFFQPNVAKLIGLPEKYHIIIGFDSERGKIHGEEYELVSSFFERAFSSLFSENYIDVIDPKFFFDKMKEFMIFLEQGQIPYLAYLGQGIVYPFFKVEDGNKRQEVMDFIFNMRAKPGSFGIGLKAKYLLDNFEKKVYQRVKLRYDPFYKINKGKIIEADNALKRMEQVPGALGRIDEKMGILKNVKEVKEAKRANEVYSRPEVAVKPIVRVKPPMPVTSTSPKPVTAPTPPTSSVPVRSSMPIKPSISISLEPDPVPAKPNLDFSQLPKPISGEEKSTRELVKRFEREEVKPESLIDQKSVQESVIQRNVEESRKKRMARQIKEYDDTFNSEFANDRMKKIEDFAKNVAKDMSARRLDKEILTKTEKQNVVKEIVHKKQVRHESSVSEKPATKPGVDYSQIQNIMTNTYSTKKEPIIERSKEIIVEGVDKNQIKDVSLPEPPQQKQTDFSTSIPQSKRSTSQEERNLINQIMSNRFGLGSESKDKKQAKEEENERGE
ncbi:FAD-binding protein [Candidatus Pacearchaeota archaeon]|nr:FAD-binding protein [Candidatus Pacearchaeota archaeon]